MSAPSSGGTVPIVGAVVGAGGVASGGGTVGGMLPSTGTGLTIVLLVVAVALVLIGLLLVWNPLGRRGRTTRVRRRPAPLATTSSG